MKIKTEVKIGIITILALTFGYIGLNFLKGIDLFKKEDIYYIKFANLNGVAKATPVLISGYKVGAVRNVEFEYRPNVGYGAIVTIAVDPDVQIPRGSQLGIKKNLLTGSELVLLPNEPKPGYIQPGDTIPSMEAAEDFMAVATDKIMPSVVEAIPQVMQTITRINELLADRRVDSMLMLLGHTTLQLNQAVTKINRSMTELPDIMQNTKAASSSFVTLGKQVEQVRVDTLMNNLNVISSNLRSMSQQLSDTQGTMGLLLNDPTLYHRLDSLATSADQLMKDLKQNPKRYVHFSIF